MKVFKMFNGQQKIKTILLIGIFLNVATTKVETTKDLISSTSTTTNQHTQTTSEEDTSSDQRTIVIEAETPNLIVVYILLGLIIIILLILACFRKYFKQAIGPDNNVPARQQNEENEHGENNVPARQQNEEIENSSDETIPKTVVSNTDISDHRGTRSFQHTSTDETIPKTYATSSERDQSHNQIRDSGIRARLPDNTCSSSGVYSDDNSTHFSNSSDERRRVEIEQGESDLPSTTSSDETFPKTLNYRNEIPQACLDREPGNDFSKESDFEKDDTSENDDYDEMKATKNDTGKKKKMRTTTPRKRSAISSSVSQRNRNHDSPTRRRTDVDNCTYDEGARSGERKKGKKRKK